MYVHWSSQTIFKNIGLIYKSNFIHIPFASFIFICRQSHTPPESLHLRCTALKGYKRKKAHTLIYQQGMGIQVIMGQTCTSNDTISMSVTDKLNVSREHWWYDTDNKKLMCYSAHYQTHTDQPEIETRPMLWGQWWMEKEWSKYVTGKILENAFTLTPRI
jgi:hypothetical protein